MVGIFVWLPSFPSILTWRTLAQNTKCYYKVDCIFPSVAVRFYTNCVAHNTQEWNWDTVSSGWCVYRLVFRSVSKSVFHISSSDILCKLQIKRKLMQMKNSMRTWIVCCKCLKSRANDCHSVRFGFGWVFCSSFPFQIRRMQSESGICESICLLALSFYHCSAPCCSAHYIDFVIACLLNTCANNWTIMLLFFYSPTTVAFCHLIVIEIDSSAFVLSEI